MLPHWSVNTDQTRKEMKFMLCWQGQPRAVRTTTQQPDPQQRPKKSGSNQLIGVQAEKEETSLLFLCGQVFSVMGKKRANFTRPRRGFKVHCKMTSHVAAFVKGGRCHHLPWWRSKEIKRDGWQRKNEFASLKFGMTSQFFLARRHKIRIKDRRSTLFLRCCILNRTSESKSI